jgi:hypothetical protein
VSLPGNYGVATLIRSFSSWQFLHPDRAAGISVKS